VTGWTADRLPITVAPLPGEALPSWIAAYARRMRTTSSGLIAHLGLGGTRLTRMVLRLHDSEAAVLERATGVSAPVLAGMTLEAYDGLVIATVPDRRALVLRAPAGTFGNPRVRYCPACLARDDGRGPVTWLLPWSFACPLHRVLLADFCPACHRPPRPWNARRLGPRAGGACTLNARGQPAGDGGRACGADLRSALTGPLPVGGLVLAAHQHLAELMTGPPSGRDAALTALRQVYTAAGRVLRGLHAIPGQAPAIVHAVLAEAGAGLPGPAGAEVWHDARSAAIGATLACVALDDAHPDHEDAFGWIMQADRALVAGRQGKPGIGALAGRWAWSGPHMVGKVLGALDGEANLHVRLRYGTATPRPRWPDLPAAAITRRAAMIPAMLWPGWTMRLLPLQLRGPGTPDGAARTRSFSAFRRGCASFLLLPGGPQQMNFERAAPLLGNSAYGPDRHAIERIIYAGRDLTPLASVLAQLALALDEYGSPIDYARRRAVFTSPADVTVDPGAYTRLRLQHGWSPGSVPREAVLRWYLLVLLTGEHPALPGTRKPFGGQCTEFRFRAPGPLRAFLRQQATASLAWHGITEPVTWEPPTHWATWPAWPGADPAGIARDDATALLATASAADAAATALGLTAEHVRLYCEVAETGTPAPAANTRPASQARADILDPARLRGLYQDQHVPVSEIAAMAGCGGDTVRRLLRIDGVPPRFRNRRPSPESGITRDWLEYEYTGKLRSIGSLARERGVSAYYLMSLARHWGLPIRHHSEFSGIGHLNLRAPLSPAMRAVTMRTGPLGRLELITQIPGHASLAAAARAIYGGRPGALQQQLVKIEKAAGFTIIDRTATPLAPTEAGREFIREALQILRAARRQATPAAQAAGCEEP
jgi:hypothetical protein